MDKTNELLESRYKFPIREAIPLLREVPSILKTHIEGKKTDRLWPLSASVLLPIMEHVAGVYTPCKLLPVVADFYKYIRFTDDFFDNYPGFPDWSETQLATQQLHNTLLGSITNVVDENDAAYMVERIDYLRENVYQVLQNQHLWVNSLSFRDAYDYRWNTTGILSDVVAELWCLSAGVTGEVKTNIRHVTQKFGMFLQFWDDLIDVREDEDTDGNLVRAILNEEGQKETFLNSCTSESKTPILTAMLSSAPKSLERILKYMKDENEEIRKISPRIAEFLDSFMLVSLPRIRG